MNVTAIVEVSVRQVFSLPVFILTENSIRDTMSFNFGHLNARAKDPTTTSGLINLLMRPMVGFLLKPLLGLLLKEVSGTARRLPTRTAYG